MNKINREVIDYIFSQLRIKYQENINKIEEEILKAQNETAKDEYTARMKSGRT